MISTLEQRFAENTNRRVMDALDAYELYLREKGNRATSRAATMFRLRGFFKKTLEKNVRWVTPDECASLYDELASRLAVDSHRNMLAEAKTFLGWCVAKTWVRANHLEDVVGRGRRRRGKEQLRIDEARKWLARARQLAEEGEPGAVAAMLTLLLGLRCSEVISRTVRDLDDDGHLLWIPESKTEAGRRKLAVPDLLRALLLELAEGKTSTELLFGYHDRAWPRKWVQRICRDVEVQEVTAHGMRGLHSTLALDAGQTAPVVAAALGHESSATTLGHYAAPGAGSAARQDRTLEALAGRASVQGSVQGNEKGPE